MIYTGGHKMDDFLKYLATNEEDYGPGSLLITFPGEWHRYMPLKSTGRTEIYIGFKGSMAQKFIQDVQFSIKSIKEVSYDPRFESIHYFSRLI